MDWLELAKTLGSAAGLATLAWRGLDAWDARKDRLKIRTTQEVGHKLDLMISYRAKSEHTGLKATLEVIKPKVGEVLLLRPMRGHNLTIDQAVELIMAREVIGKRAEAAMVLSANQPGLFEVSGQIFADDERPTAKIKVTIRDLSTGRRLQSRTEDVAPSQVG